MMIKVKIVIGLSYRSAWSVIFSRSKSMSFYFRRFYLLKCLDNIPICEEGGDYDEEMAERYKCE